MVAISNSVDRFNGVIASLAVKVPCVATAIVPIVLSGIQTVNGVAVTAGQRVLVTAQASPVENGIYDVNDAAWTRSADFDGNRDVTTDTYLVSARSAGSPQFWRCTSVLPITIGSSNITFVEFFDPDAAGGGATQLSELSDVNTSTPTNRFVLVADGVDFESRVLVEADISDLQAYLTTEVNNLGASVTWANIPIANVPTGVSGVTVALGDHTQLLASGATDVTATAAEVNLLDLAGLTAGWILSADTASTASWKAAGAGIAAGTVLNATIRWDGADWVENTQMRKTATDDLELYAPGVAITDNSSIYWYTSASVLRGSFGWGNAGSDMLWASEQPGTAVQIRARVVADNADTVILDADPDSATSLNGKTGVLIEYAGSPRLRANSTDLALYFSGTEVARTMSSANGGLEVDNDYNGENGAPFERVLTESQQDWITASASYTFDTGITAADPGIGDLKFNNATLSSATAMYVDQESQWANKIFNWLWSSLSDGDVIIVRSNDDILSYMICSVNGTPTDNTGWWTIPIKVIQAGTTPSANDLVNVSVQYISKATELGVSPINTQNGNYTLLLGDKGQTIHKATSTVAITHTIPANGAVAFPIGSLVAWQNDGTVNMTIAITTDTLTGTDAGTGSRTLGPSHAALAQKMTATTWKYMASDL